MLRPDRGIAAAQALSRRALASDPDRAPRKVPLDGHVPSHRALQLLQPEHPAWRRVRVRSSKYLNNIIEQGHRAIKRRCASMKGFKSFANVGLAVGAGGNVRTQTLRDFSREEMNGVLAKLA